MRADLNQLNVSVESMKRDREQLSLDVQRLRRDYEQYKTRAEEQQKAADERFRVRVSGLRDSISDFWKPLHMPREEVKETRSKAERLPMHDATTTRHVICVEKSWKNTDLKRTDYFVRK